MREDECDDPGEFDRPTDEANDLTVGRREYLKLTGGGIGFGAITILGGEVVQADDSGFGEGGYGMSPYGGEGLGVSTQGPTDVKPTTATMNGAVTELDDAESAECYFEWRQTNTDTWSTTVTETLSSTGDFSYTLYGLGDGTDYEYRAVAETSGATASGDIVTCTTIEVPPVVTAEPPSNVTETSVTLNGSLDDLGHAESAECYFEWREKGSSSINTTSKRDLSSPGSFSADISGLTSGTDYEFWAVAEASDGDTATNAEFSTH